ncbi:DNA polymerase III subunit beta [Adlercreutzia caecimuris]|uniref:DNA polymerase III subunit beta n=1 Tax=Adlercreutzia caecimuris TaxID=671266 RepID=A0A4S4G247_9ACTN|nr:DNA polymerase III subunit beta [Adlercreutzia caecimuris]THG36868.1 hypothetical protein E5986_08175 [Adlercreutzia caecimuris]
MIVTIDKDELRRVMASPCKIAKGQKENHLACLLITAKGDALTVEANDLDESCSVSATALVEEEGRVLVSARSLDSIVKSMSDGAVSLTGDGTDVTVSSGRASFDLPSLDPSDFPSFPAPEDGRSVAVPADSLSALVKACAWACADPGKGVGSGAGRTVEGVLVEAGGGVLRMTGTDGLAMVRAKCDAPGVGEMRDPFPPSFLAAAAAACAGHDVTLSASRNQLRISGPGVVMSTRGYSKEYPKCDKFFEGDANCSARIGRAVALDAARRAAVIPGTSPVRLGFDDSGVTFVRSSDRESMRETVDAEVSAPCEIGLNARYLVDALACLGDGAVNISMQDPLKPFILRAGSTEALLMPVRLR